jgi:hypothetical protein
LTCRAASRSHLLHYIVIVALEDIPKFTELTYNYGSMYTVPDDMSDIHTHAHMILSPMQLIHHDVRVGWGCICWS